MLCVSCILENDHKNHDLSSIDKAAQKERALFEEGYDKVLLIEEVLRNSLDEVENNKKIINEKAEKNINDIESFFNEIKLVIEERENIVKSKILRVLDSEVEYLATISEQLNTQMNNIELIKKEKENYDNMTELEILSKTKENMQIIKDILVDPPQISNEVKFYQMKKEDEIGYIKKSIYNLLRSKTAEPVIEKERIAMKTQTSGERSSHDDSTFNMSKKNKDTEKRINELNKALSTNKKDDRFKTTKSTTCKDIYYNIYSKA